MDYTFRNEKLFDFAQIEIEEKQKEDSDSLYDDGWSLEGDSDELGAKLFELTQNNLNLLDSFSIEEKLNFPLVDNRS